MKSKGPPPVRRLIGFFLFFFFLSLSYVFFALPFNSVSCKQAKRSFAFWLLSSLLLLFFFPQPITKWKKRESEREQKIVDGCTDESIRSKRNPIADEKRTPFLISLCVV
jgi:hypothetical protein